MHRIALAKKEIDLKQVVIESGVELTERGHRSCGRCPFHEDKDPSFYVFEDGYYHCFGCQSHGDVISYVQNKYNFTFPQALTFLGIQNTGKSRADDKKLLADLAKKKKEKLERVQRERDLLYTLSVLIKATHKAKELLTPEKLNQYGNILDPLAYWTYCHDTLAIGTDEDKSAIIEALKDMKAISRNYLFDKNFDYRGWLRKMEKTGEPNGEPKYTSISFE